MNSKLLVIRVAQSLPYWWYAWRSGGTSRRALWLQVVCMIWVGVKGDSRRV
jgi:hypothetical protein